MAARRALAGGAASSAAETAGRGRAQVEATKSVRGSGSADPTSLRELPGELLREAPAAAARKSSVVVQIAGREYRIRSDGDPAWLQQVAGLVDRAMTLIRERTETVDTLEVAVLTALNLGREIVLLRQELSARQAAGTGAGDGSSQPPEPERLRELIELAESALEPADRGA